jgi:hypothetical protein
MRSIFSGPLLRGSLASVPDASLLFSLRLGCRTQKALPTRTRQLRHLALLNQRLQLTDPLPQNTELSQQITLTRISSVRPCKCRPRYRLMPRRLRTKFSISQ